ncbi:MAG: hypothetical protein EBR67_10730 [Proteobacteria bacterium]|nr:hypothetical protein [Pseudomonadota bacterium]
MIISDSLKYFIGILNSRLNKWYFPLIASGLGKGGCRYFKIFVEAMPIPSINNLLRSEIEKLADEIISITKNENYSEDKQSQIRVQNLEEEIDNLVYQLYELTSEEIDLIKRATEFK